VIGLSADTSIEMYNIKGLKLYETYYCSHEITQMCFTDNGKQLCLACEDNRLRVLIPKTSEFKTITGPLQHQTEISAIKSKDNFLVSGCIDGYIGVASLSNYKMLSMIGAK
jgi:WD40 repeat protein